MIVNFHNFLHNHTGNWGFYDYKQSLVIDMAADNSYLCAPIIIVLTSMATTKPAISCKVIFVAGEAYHKYTEMNRNDRRQTGPLLT